MEHKLTTFVSFLLLALSTSANAGDLYSQHLHETQTCAQKMISQGKFSISEKEEIAGYIADSKAYREVFQYGPVALVSFKFLDDADNKIGHPHPHNL